MAKRAVGLVLLAVFLSACATLPAGPSVMVWPGPSKSFEQFQADDALCRQWAYQQIGTTPGQAASESAASAAVIGSVLGAVAGAAIGSASGHVGAGAAIGAGTGLLASGFLGNDESFLEPPLGVGFAPTVVSEVGEDFLWDVEFGWFLGREKCDGVAAL